MVQIRLSHNGEIVERIPPPAPALTPLLLTPKEVGELLRISERKVWDLAKDNEIDLVRIGKARRHSLESVKAFIERHKAGQ
jgi:excisionase family DNA binding protein